MVRIVKKLIDTGPHHITQRITYRHRPPPYHTKNNATVVGKRKGKPHTIKAQRRFVYRIGW